MSIKYHYGCFPPSDELIDWNKIIPLLGPTYAAVANYGGILSAIPNPAVLLTPLTTQEAVLSSRIEGTQATIGEVFEFEATGDTGKFNEERKNDISEILNYRKAMAEAVKQLNTYPLSIRVLKAIHQVLLENVRGTNKAPGEFRKIANWIGPYGCSIEEAYFVPISADKLLDGISTWEKFIHQEFKDNIVKLALLHVEFESLHPFLDGNGRLGRIFIPLFLWQTGIISLPMFYISATLEKRREEYYQKLRNVSQNNGWTDWIVFFLDAVKEQADNNKNKAKQIFDLYDEMKDKIQSITNSRFAISLLDFIFKRPIFSTSLFVEETKIQKSSAQRLLLQLQENNIISVLQEGKGRKGAVLSFPAILSITE